MPEWTGTILKWRHLNTFHEHKELRATGNKPAILPCHAFDPARPPALLIHGVGTPAILRSLAKRLDDGGYQVWFAFYDELEILPHRNGASLGAKLDALREEIYPPETSLVVVAHSIGAIVARCMLNALQEPGWRQDGQTSVGAPRAGFADVRLRTIDAPWSGFGSDDPDDYDDDHLTARIIRQIMKLLGVEGAYSMAAGSQTFEHLYEVDLDGVDIQNLVARRRSGRKDWVPSLPESSPADVQAIARCLVYDEPPAKLTVKNLCGGLRQDSRAPALKQAIEAAIAAGTIDLTAPATGALVQKITKLHDAVMPRYWGTHIGVAIDKESDAQDLVDALIDELC